MRCNICLRVRRLPPQQGALEKSEHRSRSGIYLDAAGLSQRVLRNPAAKHADGRDVRLPRCGGIVGRVTDRDGVGAFDLELLENGFEDIRRRLRLLGVVGRSRKVHKVGDARNIEVLLKFILLGRGSDRNTSPASRTRRSRSGTAEKGRTSGKYSVLRSIAAPFFQFFAVVPLFVLGQKDRNQLVSPFSDLAPSLLEAYIVAKPDHRFVPCDRVQIHRVHKRAVQVEDSGGFRQIKVLQVGTGEAPFQSAAFLAT